jgi:hypothetical protein
MATDPKLESYLEALDRRLGAVPTSDRAEIVTEIKSHVLEAQAREPARSLTDILASIGEPEAVANKYLLERGLTPGKPSKTPIAKWLTIGFLGTLGLFVLLVGIVLWRFTPVISIAEKKISILGGMVEIDGDEGTLAVGNTKIEGKQLEGQGRTLRGSTSVDADTDFFFRLPFTNGDVEVRPSVDRTLRWDCKYFGGADGMTVSEAKKKLALLAEKAAGIECDIEIPKGVGIEIDGKNGKVEIDRPTASTVVKLSNGKVGLGTEAGKKYRYNLSVSLGRIDPGFESALNGTGGVVPITVEVGNGKIERL